MGERELIADICDKHRIIDYTICEDALGLYTNVVGDVRLTLCSLFNIPIRFGIVTGDFMCSYNRLTSLFGCPVSVGGDFFCVNNQLLTLEHCPKEVLGSFNCRDNQLTSLKFCPNLVGDSFYCGDNKLTSLEYSPVSVSGDFYCDNNILPTLEGCPTSVSGDYYCNNNILTSLEGFPVSVNGIIRCSSNYLFSFDGFSISQGKGNKIECFCNPLDIISFYHLFDLGYYPGNIISDTNLFSIYRQWVIKGIING
jgi:hypothetical protein